VDALVVASVPLESDLNFLTFLRLVVEANLAKQRLLRVIEVANVINDSAVVLIRLFRFATLALVLKRISSPRFKNAMICNRSRMVCARNSTSSKIVGSGVKVTVVPVRPEARYQSPSAPHRLTAVLERQHVVITVLIDLEDQLGRQRVHYRHANTMETPETL